MPTVALKPKYKPLIPWDQVEQQYSKHTCNGYEYVSNDGKYIYFSKLNTKGTLQTIRFKRVDFVNNNFELMCKNDLTR